MTLHQGWFPLIHSPSVPWSALTARDATKMIAKQGESLISASGVPYVQNCRLYLSDDRAVINTSFFVDHTEVNRILENQKTWRLGSIDDGEEFFAFVFAD